MGQSDVVEYLLNRKKEWIKPSEISKDLNTSISSVNRCLKKIYEKDKATFNLERRKYNKNVGYEWCLND